MHKKIFSAIFLTTTLLLIIANVMILLAVESILTKQAFIELKKEAKILETNISNLIENKIPNTYRISIIQENGEVIYDNTNENLQNHNDRVEIINAIINNEATSIRYSDTMKTNMLYFANLFMIFVSYSNGGTVTGRSSHPKTVKSSCTPIVVVILALRLTWVFLIKYAVLLANTSGL